MKKSIYLLVFLAAIAADACECYFQPCDKQYVDQKQIEFTDNEIHIQLRGSEFATSAIYRDDKGFYFKDFKKQGDCPDGKWECKVCHFCNPHYTLYCGACWN